jgi:thiamine-monophosphate kinase
MAAMGATPRWATLALALPRADARWLTAFSRGFMALARRFGVDLIGGDTTRGPLTLCVQIMGEVPRGKALRRDGARPGDDIWVSGTVGDAALALAALKRRIRLEPAELVRCAAKLHRPQPRIALGLALRGVARGAIDISDGLLGDLGHICERSRVAAVVHFDRVPASAIMQRYLDRPAARAALLAGGDDYELCFTAGRGRRAAIERLAQRLRLKLTCIGGIVRRGGAPVTLLDAGGRPVVVKHQGYEHF